MDCAVGKPAASRGRRLGPRGRSRRRIAPPAKADDRPRQRSPAGLEAVNVTGTDPEGAGFDTIPAMLSRALVAVFAIPAIVGCNQSQAVQAIDKLKPCTGYDTPVDAYCGTLKVYENRATKQGRQIDLNIVVLPALRSDAAPDPLFFLAGGPGQGAAKMAKTIRDAYRQILTDRDIVLVDQRGTGKSTRTMSRSVRICRYASRIVFAIFAAPCPGPPARKNSGSGCASARNAGRTTMFRSIW